MAEEKIINKDLEYEELNYKKTVIKKVLKIPYTQNSGVTLRIYDGKERIFYASTRLGTIVRTKDGCEAELREIEPEGKRYDLTDTVSKKIIMNGMIVKKQNQTKAVKKDEE
ncbi:hypothetical protein ACSSWA_01320 [Melioribacter sp. Ez-97]|uniref:hypothetical protein n=1 Tax=Melioribacter sp. Ez-97 TaxID=3423434 RepID=UPI003EDA5E1B